MPITRSTGISVTALGIPWAGPRPGGGYEGATPALDRAVQRHARALQAWLGRRVRIEIRFNSDRQSGGAWVWDGEGLGSSCTIGLTAGIEPDELLTPSGKWARNPRARRLYHRVYLEHTLARSNVTLRRDDEDRGSDHHYYIPARGPADGIRLLKRLADPGGNRLRAARHGLPPAPDPADPKVLLARLEPAVRAWLLARLTPLRPPAGGGLALTRRQAFWLANTPLDQLGPQATPLFQALDRAGQGALIPYDNRARVLPETVPAPGGARGGGPPHGEAPPP